MPSRTKALLRFAEAALVYIQRRPSTDIRERTGDKTDKIIPGWTVIHRDRSFTDIYWWTRLAHPRIFVDRNPRE